MSSEVRGWYDRRDNELTQEDLEKAIQLARNLAAAFIRRNPGIDEFDIESRAIEGAWYAWSKYPRGATFEFWPTANVTISRFISKAVRSHYGEGATAEGRAATVSLNEEIVEPIQRPENEEALQFREMVERLPPTQREIVLAQFYGWDKPIGVPASTESHRKRKALENLRRMMEGEEPLPEVLKPRGKR